MRLNSNRTSSLSPSLGTIFQLADGSIQGCNPDAEKILGYTAEQITEADYFEPPWQTIHQDGSAFSPETHPGINSIKTGQAYCDLVMGFYRPNGTLVWLSVDSQPLFQGSKSQPYAVVVSFTKIAERASSAIETTQLTPEKLSLEAKETIAKPQLPQQHQATLLDLQHDWQFIQQIIDAVPGVIYIYDALAQQNVYLNSQVYNFLGYTPQKIAEMGADFITQVMHPEDLAKFPSHLERLSSSKQQEVHNFEYRMRHQNGEWRWFCSQDRVYSRSDDGSIEQILGVAQDISNRKQIEKNLHISKERLSLATNAAELGTWFWDLTTNCLEWTQQCKKLFGLNSEAEITYQLFLDLLHPDDRDRTDAAVKQALATQSEYDTEYRVIWADGSVHWIAAKGKGFYNQDGKPVRMMGTVQDIERRKQAEAELVKTNSILQSVISDTSSIIFVKDLQGRYVVVNQTAAEFLGVKVEETLGKNDADLFPLETAQSIMTSDRQILDEGISCSYEEEIIDGEISRTLFTNKYPWRDETGKNLGVIGICRDITALKRSQQQLKEKDKLLRLALSGAKAGSWDWEIATGKIFWSPENYELYGLDSQQGLLKYQDWESRIHPEDREAANQAVQKVLSGELLQFNHEFRIVHPQRGIRWLIGIGNVTVDNNGKPIRLSGINLDVTERQLIEEKLRRSEQQLRRVLDSLYSFVGVLTPDGILIEANRTVLEAANLQPEDALGKPFAKTYCWSYSTEVQTQLNDAIQRAAAGELVRYDVEVRLSADKYALVDFALIPLFDDTGNIEYLIPSGIDITEREASKQALKQREHELRLITEAIPQQVWTALPNGEIDYINQRWQEYTGVSLEEIRARGWSTIVHPDDLERVSKTWTGMIFIFNNWE